MIAPDRRLSVLLDATAIPVDRGGVGRYLDSIIPELARSESIRLVVACQPRDESVFAAAGARAVAAPAATSRRPARLVWEQTGLPRLGRQVGADVLHCPHYTMPLLPGRPTVVTLHDATFFSDPHVHTRTKRVFFQSATRHAVRRATGLLVPSAATRSELTRLVSARAGRAVVAHLGVDTTLFHPPAAPEVTALRQRLQLADRPFVAFLGTIEPRKNVPNLIEGWVRAFADAPDAPALVLAGGPGWDDRVDAAIARVPPQLRLIRPGYLPLDSLRALLGGAAIVCYPSLGEGFGLPVLEAMACGAPVLSTDRLALGEVGGDAIAYTEVDAASIGQNLRSLLSDSERRAELSRRGRQRAGRFSWAEAARIHVEAYRAAAGHVAAGRSEAGR